MDVGQPTLDQLRIFLAVVDEGSFTRAAKARGRAVSVISYGITTLESLLDVTLFTREGSSRPVLTDAGKALLANARAVVDEVDALMAKTGSLHQGLEPDLSLAVDVMVPGDCLARALREFQAAFPTVELTLHVEALGAVAALLLDARADLAIGGPEIVNVPGLDQIAVGAVELVPVAAPSHSLAHLDDIAPGETRRHLQLVLTDRSTLTAGSDFSVFSPQTWRLADLGAKHSLLLEGVGWGNMPRHMVADDIAAGRLVELTLPEKPGISYALNALWRKDQPPGPATRWMLDRLSALLNVEDDGAFPSASK